MTDGRQTTRAMAEEVKVGPNGDSVWAKPLPWRRRNDLGNIITTGYVDAINNSLHTIQDENGEISFTGEFREKIFPWEACLQAAFSEEDCQRLDQADIFELRAALCAALRVNGLEQLEYMIDPNIRDLLTKIQEATAEVTDGQKTTSSDDSGDSDIQ